MISEGIMACYKLMAVARPPTFTVNGLVGLPTLLTLLYGEGRYGVVVRGGGRWEVTHSIRDYRIKQSIRIQKLCTEEVRIYLCL